MMTTILPRIILLLALADVTCGFGGTVDPCREAGAIASRLPVLSGVQLAGQEEMVLRLCPDGAPGHVVRGMRLEREGKREQASDEYRQALEGISWQAGSDGRVREGDLHLLAREYDKAIDAYQAALKENPGRSDIQQKLADAQMAAGHDEQAIAVYRQLLDEEGANALARYTLGMLYERQGMLDEAEEQYRRVVQQDPANGDARRHLADIYTLRGNFSQAIREYRQQLTEHRDNPLLHFKLARALERSRQYRDAVAEYLEAIRLAPDNLEAHKELASLYLRQGKRALAAGQYRIVLQLNKEDVTTRNTLIALYVKQKEYGELFTLLKEGTTLFPDDPDSHFRLGLMHDFRKEYDDSIAEYQKALGLKSDHAKALKGLGKVYLERGDLEQARKYLEAAKRVDPKQFATSELLNNLRIEQSRVTAVKWRATHTTKKQSKQHNKKSSHAGKNKKKIKRTHSNKKTGKGTLSSERKKRR